MVTISWTGQSILNLSLDAGFFYKCVRESPNPVFWMEIPVADLKSALAEEW